MSGVWRMNVVKEWLVRLVKWFGALLLVFGLAGCAGTGGKAKESVDAPQDIVAKKALSRWDLLLKSDLDAAYGFLSPGTRSVMSLELYKAKIRPGRWKKIDFDSIVCKQDRCDVVLILEYSYRDMKSIKTRLNEIWLQEDGDWWFVPK